MNIYDEIEFFERYSQMDRSQKGLAGAGEWHILKKILPHFTQKKVLDLGCGYGWHSNYAIEQGAESVLGIDGSEKMLEVAREKFPSEKILFENRKIEELDFEADTFDVVISSLVFHYIEDYPQLIKSIAKWLKEDGQLVFTVEHPTFTAYGSQDWIYDDEGNILHFPVDHYFVEGKREAIFLGTKMTKHHRSLTTYLDTLIDEGFQIERVLEVEPENKILANGHLNDEMRRPMMLIVSARKK